MKRKTSAGKTTEFGAKFKPVLLARYFNWPARSIRGKWWRDLRDHVETYPAGKQVSWGIPFRMGQGREKRVLLVAGKQDEMTVRLSGKATYVCILHEWRQLPRDVNRDDIHEGLVVGEYELTYADGRTHVEPIRARFEVAMVESPGAPWLARSFNMYEAVDPERPPADMDWARAQTGVTQTGGVPYVYALPNPHPEKALRSLTARALRPSPLILAGLTLYEGGSHPLRHLPRRTYRVILPGGKAGFKDAELDLGCITRIEETTGPRGKKWMESPYPGLRTEEPASGAERLIEAVGSEDATLSVKMPGRKTPVRFALGHAFRDGHAPEAGAGRGRARIEVLGKTRQWMRVIVRDAATGKPTPVRIHFSGARGEYIAPYGHHAQVNDGWFMDYGADVVAGGRQFAYVHGEFTTDLPVGDLYVEMVKGFEYRPVRQKVTIEPGRKTLELTIDRAMDWRGEGWVTADTHVHFISPHTAWLEARCEGVNVVNLLASQWGRLFTNVGDLTGRVGVAEDDTIVYVGTENRNHMLGHMSMLGTRGLPVYPMCAGGPGEAWIGDPDFVAMAEWARENRRKGGLVIRPHFPYCGFTEDPVPILKGLVDALEIRPDRNGGFPVQEWYRYLNCGYRVAACGGTDKMGAGTPLGWLRTYAMLDPERAFDYDNWADAVRAGRTFASSGPLIDMVVDGRRVGDTIELTSAGGMVEVAAHAESVWPVGRLELVLNGRIIATRQAPGNGGKVELKARVPVHRSGWIAARCWGPKSHPASYMAAHTSPVYFKCGDTRAFDGPAAEHMLALVEGGIEYLNTLATRFNEASRRRMTKMFREARKELKGRLIMEAHHGLHHGGGAYHTHGHGSPADHHH